MAQDDTYTFANESSIPPGIADTIRGMIVNWDKIPNYDWVAFCTNDFDFTLGVLATEGLEADKAMGGVMFHVTNGPITHCQHKLKDVYLKTGTSPSGFTSVAFTGTVSYTIMSGKDFQEAFATTFELRGRVRASIRSRQLGFTSIWQLWDLP
jgi:hypothetical protein